MPVYLQGLPVLVIFLYQHDGRVLLQKQNSVPDLARVADDP